MITTINAYTLYNLYLSIKLSSSHTHLRHSNEHTI